MFKLDKKTLEELSFHFDERDIANLKSVLDFLKKRELFTISQKDVKDALEGLDAIARLKLDGKVYGFHVEDSYTARQSGNGEGVELYSRQGDALREFFVPGSRDFVYKIADAVHYLKTKDIRTIYTGDLQPGTEFLGLPYECDADNPVRRMILEDYEMKEFESKGIQVIRLDCLI